MQGISLSLRYPQSRVSRITEGSKLPPSGYAHLATDDMHTQQLVKRYRLPDPVTRRHSTRTDPAGGNQRGPYSPEGTGLSALPKDRVEPADRGQARQPAPDQSAHP
ncbi:MAG TPA: hypothetical protein VED43_16045 [Mycobacterium sp.]|nr:hypothetical protein [Mycobacterium sp.]